MGSTTFGYDKGEDRVWMSFNDDSPRIWLTRHMVSQLLGHMLGAFEVAAPGAMGGAPAATRVSLEHELALNELLPGEQALPMKMGSETRIESRRADYQLCTGLVATFDASRCRLQFGTAEGPRVLRMDRVGMHRWLRGLHLVTRHADWALQAPDWLTRSCLPAAVRALVEGAVPPAAPGAPGPG